MRYYVRRRIRKDQPVVGQEVEGDWTPRLIRDYSYDYEEIW
jgi:hypothetical protein